MSSSPNRLTLALLVVVLGLLALEGVRAIGDVRRELAAAPPTPRPRPPDDPAANALPAEALAPRLLKDEAETAQYLAAFPQDAYRVHELPGYGLFHLDDARDLIKDLIRQGRPWEPGIHAFLTQRVRPGTTALDVGAHIGTHTLTLARAVGPTGRVYAFEPQRKLHRELVRNVALNGLGNVVALRYAVGDTTAIVSMAAADDEGGTRLGTGGDRVELRALDSFGFRNVSLLKIDVETFEDAVLRGSRQLLLEQRPTVVVEIQATANFDDARAELRARIVHTIRSIEELGYYVFRIGTADYAAIPLEEAR